MTILRELETLKSSIAKLIPQSSKRLVAIEGFSSAGIGLVSAYLNEALNLPTVYVDDYFAGDGKNFESFDVQKFSAVVTQFIASSSLIVDGVMVRDMLGRINRKADVSVYVKRVNPYGVWSDGFKLDKLLRVIEPEKRSGYNSFQEQLIQYHLRVRPHERTDFVFEIIEGGA